nr:hypothetical protein [Klebsiella pneumoniae]
MFITDGMVRVFVYSMATVLFLPLGLLKSTWWFSPLFAIAAIDYLMFLRRQGLNRHGFNRHLRVI